MGRKNDRSRERFDLLIPARPGITYRSLEHQPELRYHPDRKCRLSARVYGEFELLNGLPPSRDGATRPVLLLHLSAAVRDRLRNRRQLPPRHYPAHHAADILCRGTRRRHQLLGSPWHDQRLVQREFLRRRRGWPSVATESRGADSRHLPDYRDGGFVQGRGEAI